jgi:outer membrane protein OmpA-like peptidoglycan-associated protein
MSASRNEQAEVVRLKELLFAEERHSLATIREVVEQHHDRIGTDERLIDTVAEVLAESFKSADIKDHRELASAVSPLVVSSIKREIVNSRDEMVEALYPIMGRLVSAYVAAAMRDIMESTNQRLESGLSLRFLRLRLKSLFTGRPYRELVLLESGNPRVRELLLIKRNSGVLVDRWRAPGEPPEAANGSGQLMGGLLSAINDFARQAFAGGKDELRSLDIGGSRLFLRTSAAHILAVSATGATGRRVQRAIDDALVDILEAHADALIDSEEPRARSEIRRILPETAKRLGELLDTERRKPVLALALLTLLGLAAAGAIGWYGWEHYQKQQLVRRVTNVIEAAPAFRGYPLDIVVAPGRRSVRLAGLAPSNAEAQRLATEVEAAIAPVSLEPSFAFVSDENALQMALAELNALAERFRALDDSLTRFAGQSDLQAVAALIPNLASEVDALSKRLDQAAAKPDVARVSGDVAAVMDQLTGLETAVAALGPKLEDLRSRVDDPLLQLAKRVATDAVFFDVATSILNRSESGRLVADAARLALASGSDLRVVGYTDPLGTLESNRVLAAERAGIVADMLVEAGLPRDRLILVARPDGPRISDVTSTDGQSDRRVDLEVAFRGERSFGGGGRP